VYAHDRQGRVTMETGPVHSVQLPGATSVTPVRQVIYHTYDDAARQRRTARGYVTAPAAGTPAYYTVGWVSVQNMDAAGRVVEEFEAVRSGAEEETVSGALTASEAFPPSSWRRLRRMGYDTWGRLGWSRVYHKLEVSGDGLSIIKGAPDTHYAQTTYGYDVMDRQNRVVDPSGTITRTYFDARGQVLSRWVGTDDTGMPDEEPEEQPAGVDMLKVETLTYDEDTGLLIQHDRHVDGSTVRSEFFRYDEFDRLIRHQRGTGDSAILETYEYDRQNRVTRTLRFHGLTADMEVPPTETHANFLGQQVRSFDTRGLVYKEVAHSADPDTTPGLTTERWFDASGNVIKAKAPGSEAAQKVVCDGVERGMARYVVLETEETPGSESESTSESESSSSESSSESSSSDSISTDDTSSSSDFEQQNQLVAPNYAEDHHYPRAVPGGSSSDSESSGSESSSDSSSSAAPGSESSSSGSSSSSEVPPPPDPDPDPDPSSSSSSSTSFSSGDISKVGPAPCPCCCDCEDTDPAAPCGNDQSGTAGSSGPNQPAPGMPKPVRHATGGIDLEEHDLSSSGLSFKFGITRCYNNLTEEGTGLFGRGWHVAELPVLIQEPGTNGDIVMMTGSVRNEWFTFVSGNTYKSLFGGLSTLVHEDATETLPSRWVLHTRSGSRLTFFDFNSPSDLDPKCQGRLWSMTNRNGETVAVSWREDGTGAPAFIEWATVGGRKIRYDFALHSSEAGPGSVDRVASVTHSVNEAANGAYLPVQQALYTYWDDGEWGGHGGCLKTVTIQHYNTALSDWTTVRQHYYRYYGPDDEDGPAGALKYVFGPAAVARLRQDFPTSWDTLANGLLLRPYADLRFTYDSLRRVRRERVHGFTEKYELSWMHRSTPGSGLDSPNQWDHVATETRPDGSTVKVVSNAAGYGLLQVFHDAVTGKDWAHAWKYDPDTGRLSESIPHSAIESPTLPTSPGVDWSLGSIGYAEDTGPVSVYGFYDDEDTISPGRFKSESIRAGSEGPAKKLRERTYAKANDSSTQVTPLVSEKVIYGENEEEEEISTTLHYGYQYRGGGFVGGNGVPEEIETPVANDVSTDIVFEQEKPLFDAAGNLLLTTRWLRLHSTADDVPDELVGPADDPGPKALRSYTAFYPDGVGRTHSVADRGTNGGAVFDRLDTANLVAPTASSATVLVSRSRWLVSGAPEAYESVAPDGKVTRWENDPAGRRIRLWENFTDDDDTHLDANRLTEYGYHLSGQLASLTAWNRKMSGTTIVLEAQTTRWAYGTTLSDSGLATGHLLRAKIYPDSDDTAGTPPGHGPDGLYRRSEFTYNRAGEVTTFKDPAGTVHTYTFDQHGRLLDDAVTLPEGSPLDASVLRISRAYEPDGSFTTITSYNAAEEGDQVNQVKLEFNTWGQLTADRQSHDSTTADTGGVPAVLYAYNNGSVGGGQPGPLNSLRRTAMTLPDGRVVAYELAAGTDTRLGRLSSLGYHVSGTTTPELQFTYAGVAMPVRMEYPAPTGGLQWTLLHQSGESASATLVPYTGLDRFGRLIQARWLTTGGSPATRVDVQYGYDTGSRRTKRHLPHAPSGNKEAEVYTYDGLSQITRRQRGVPEFQGSEYIAVAYIAREENWAFDVLGNWQRYTVKQGNDAIPPVLTTTFDHTRTHNPANQITGFSNTSEPVTHDPAGNLTASSPAPGSDGHIYWDDSLLYQWDAWNRLIKITHSQTAAVIATHAYDGLTRRTTLTENGLTRHFYYNDQWRSVEERLDDATVPERQHLYNPLNRWHLILRDRNTSPPPAGTGSSESSSSESSSSSTAETLDERLYCLHDAMDPVAIVEPSGAVVERYNYSAFGMRRVMDADFADRDTGTAFAWNWDFHGEFSDAASGLHNYGLRYYKSVSSTWLGRDPIAENGGLNLFVYLENSAANSRDKLGLEPRNTTYQRSTLGLTAPVIPGKIDPLHPHWAGTGVNCIRCHIPPPSFQAAQQMRMLNLAALVRQKAVEELQGDCWLSHLPNCPCSILLDGPCGCPKDDRIGEGWTMAGKANSTHPGGTWEVRWTNPNYGTEVPGQQCVYDACGKLITKGAAAGTPDKRGFDSDKWKIDPANWGHACYDVIPYIVMTQGGYLEIRPPNNGNNCPENDGKLHPPSSSTCTK